MADKPTCDKKDWPEENCINCKHFQVLFGTPVDAFACIGCIVKNEIKERVKHG